MGLGLLGSCHAGLGGRGNLGLQSVVRPMRVPGPPQHTHASQPASFPLSPQLMSWALRAEEETSVPLQLTHDTQASLVPDTHD